MSLTTKDILEKTFKRSFKGYDEDEVDKFLDEVIDELKALENENEALKKEIIEVKELESNIKDTEETIMNTLVSAQKSSERILREAARKAELLIDNAENTAKQKSEQTKKDLVDMERKLSVIKQSAGNFAMSFTDMINAQATSFEKTYQSFFGDMDAFSSSGISTEALEKIDKSISDDIEEIVGTSNTANVDEKSNAQPSEEDRQFTTEDEQQLEVEWSLPANEQQPQVLHEEATAEQPDTIEAKDTKTTQENEAEEILIANDAEDNVSQIVKNEPSDVFKTSPETSSGDVEPMPINEINKVLTQIEENGDEEPNAVKSKYDDYSWLYGDDKKTSGLSFKDPKEGEQLKNLIDDVID